MGFEKYGTYIFDGGNAIASHSVDCTRFHNLVSAVKLYKSIQTDVTRTCEIPFGDICSPLTGDYLKLHYVYNVKKDILTLTVSDEHNWIIDSLSEQPWFKGKKNNKTNEELEKKEKERYIPVESKHNEVGNVDYIINKNGEMIGLVIFDFFKRLHNHCGFIYMEYDKFRYPRNYMEGWAVDILISFFTGKSWMPDYDPKKFFYLCNTVDPINDSVEYMYRVIDEIRERLLGIYALNGYQNPMAKYTGVEKYDFDKLTEKWSWGLD